MSKLELEKVCEQVGSVIKGKDEVIRVILAAALAGGHVLMEDIPGVGKTTLATSFAKSLSLDYNRVQFTPDVLPSDLLGFSMYNQRTQEFEFHEGSVQCNLLLADEINRTSPKTQSALLEVMEEKQASVDGVTRKLPDPFLVIATQNPAGSAGTQMLPESQLDRFMISASMGYPKHEDAVNLLKGQVWDKLPHLTSVIELSEFKRMQEEAAQVFVKDNIYEYIVALTEETRKNTYFSMGASPRASIALLKMSRAVAYMDDRDYVTAQDVQDVLVNVLAHRVKLSSLAKSEGLTARECIYKMAHTISVPK